jgi:hypothetical protein
MNRAQEEGGAGTGPGTGMGTVVGRQSAKPLPGTDADGILRELTTRQHLTPHRPLGRVVAETVEQVGACPIAAERAIARLDLDPARAIGRLRRGELIQLARGMYRLWTRALSADLADGDALAAGATESTARDSLAG